MPIRLDKLSRRLQDYLFHNLFELAKDINEVQFRRKMMLLIGRPAEPYYEIRTPLQHAAEWGAEDMVVELLANGANVRLADGPGESPLMMAVKNKQQKVIDLLCNEIRAQALALLWDLKNKPKETIVQELTRFINLNAIFNPFDEFVETLDLEMMSTKDLYNQTLAVLKDKVLNPILLLLPAKNTLQELIYTEELKKLLIEKGFDLSKGILQEPSKPSKDGLNLLNFVVSQGSKEFFWMMMYLGYKELGALALMLRFHKPCLFLEPKRDMTLQKVRHAFPRPVIANIISFLVKPFSDKVIPVTNPQLFRTAINDALSSYDRFWLARIEKDEKARQEVAQQQQRQVQQPAAICFSADAQTLASQQSQSSLQNMDTQPQTHQRGQKRKEPSNGTEENNMPTKETSGKSGGNSGEPTTLPVLKKPKT